LKLAFTCYLTVSIWASLSVFSESSLANTGQFWDVEIAVQQLIAADIHRVGIWDGIGRMVLMEDKVYYNN
jgi:hypothetical protein